MPRYRTVIIYVLLASACAGCNSHAYWSEAMQYHAVAQDVLIAKSICASEQDCQMKSLLFAEGGEVDLGFVNWGGVSISLYETRDSELVEAIIEKFKELHSQLGKPIVTLTVYSSKHLESNVKFREVVVE